MAKKKDDKKKKSVAAEKDRKPDVKTPKNEIDGAQDLKDTLYFKSASTIYRFGQSFLGAKLKEHNLDKGQWGFLTELLFYSDGISQEELSERLSIDKSNTTRALKVLEDQGYITRVEDPVTRKKYIYLTEYAKTKRDDIRAIQQECNDVLLSGFSDDEAKKARKFLDHIRDNIISYRTEQDAEENNEE